MRVKLAAIVIVALVELMSQHSISDWIAEHLAIGRLVVAIGGALGDRNGLNPR
jgi:hypothetical protein